ncbi:MG406 family protein [Mesoplasma lactucae]|uniref:Uncharacterized protein n=1 Tax=Mesoplasma lactucae ATCC 49193 TaxID=81460 RepID=A0A291IRV7_9MOLU|nr:MG406 family protein [Mesoplasma lactucae]ATG97655.1 hypothetical protein CP520_02860 [Mesoplasma lactucae ATCC 49193]ATZ19881.1 hypothetical protein MLACT_v1c00560 [Mesoplasma lactucae ATCC 49193]MCL8216744.1 hypothetical protein [Mesoplasma lactucae ATCC 49193]
MKQLTKKPKHRWNQENKWFYISLVLLITFTLVLLAILVACKVISWEWITGYAIAAICTTIALFGVMFSYKALVKTENYYYFIFLFILRIGLYFIPFIFSVFIPNDIFNIYGVLIGFSPIILIPLIQGFEAVIKDNRTTNMFKKNQKKEGGNNVAT